ncbi:unnamed protein product [Prorocentrum cordatum]|uniref:Uncharacterized protein n=1 Tax=Prorocentrum cordatum TaxID=2364126 RepID=A0ABN9U0W5_9DINO|nr:unnamed protein product [Polarella glacialis]
MAARGRSQITLCLPIVWYWSTVAATATDASGGLFDPTPAPLVPTEDCYPEDVWRLQGWADYNHVFERCGPELVCQKDLRRCEKFCNVDEECEGFPHRVCDGTDFRCKHGSLFKGSVGADVGAAFLFSFISGLALSAGIGGGGLYVPLLMVILGFTVREATGLSQACLSGGSASALLYNLRQRHPSGKKPMIDYTLVLIMGPCLLIGALIGSSLNPVAPSWLILALLMIVLSHSAWKAFGKAVTTFRKEQAGEVRGMAAAGDARLSKNFIARCIHLFSGKPYPEHQDQHGEPPGVVVGRPAEDDSSVRSAGAAGNAATQEAAAAYVVGKPVAAGSATEASGEKAAAGQVLGPMDAEKADIGRNAQLSRPSGGRSSSSAAADAQPATTLDAAAGPSSIHVDLGANDPSQQAPASNSASITGVAMAADAGAQRQYPRRKLMGFASMWLITALGILARGGRDTSTIVTIALYGIG